MKTIKPIAVFHSPLTSKFGIPRQSGLAQHLEGVIELLPPYNKDEALRGLEDFSHLWLVWGFSANKPLEDDKAEKLTVRPPRLGGNKRLGVFATRSPFRPNGLGLSAVRILKVGKGSVTVAEADLMDGTPIYDIKPYLPYVDCHPEAKGGFTDAYSWKALAVEVPRKFADEFTEGQLSALKEVLSQDPRPQYQHDEERVYGMPFAGFDVQFKVSGGTAVVVGVK